MFKTLVDTVTLATHLDDPHWVVVDCRFILTDPGAGRRSYAVGHIPGARYAHLDDDLSAPITATTGRHPLPDPVTLAGKLGAWGIGNDTQVVVYDDSFGSIAARLWWLLRWLGHEPVALLDGGIPKWKREGRAITDQPAAITAKKFVPQVNDSLRVEATEVERIRTHSGSRLIDVRAEERFSGERETLDAVAGHIPGARNVPFDDNLDNPGTYLAPEALRTLYGEVLGNVAPADTVVMCGSGVTACHTLLALEHAGLHGAKLYPGSWSEWIRDPARPVATGEE
jgi:thiosulfate/3-mercaptopyruvate sulfurtransferase